MNINQGPARLECGHPVECLTSEPCDDERQECGWCEEVGRLQGQVESLQGQLESKAIIVRGGDMHVTDGPIGYLVVESGNVQIGPRDTTDRVDFHIGHIVVPPEARSGRHLP